MSSRFRDLAHILINHSCDLRAGEKVLIEAFDLPDDELVNHLVELASELGAVPVVSLRRNGILRSLYKHATTESMAFNGTLESHRMSQMDAYIGIRASDNTAELSDVPLDKMALFQDHWWKPVHSEIRVRKTKWVVLRYPTPSMAQAANMSTTAFRDFFLGVCTVDYPQMGKDLRPLQARMEDACWVRITGPETELKFSIENIPVVPCFGRRNIPDGEVFTAPIRDSVNGTIKFNTSTRYHGTVFQGIQLTFKDGRIVDASCQGNTEALNQILDSDDGARYIGEWSMGCNNQIAKPMLDTLFDEKIGGSFHLTPGQAYEVADNGNRSSIHWDLVMLQTRDVGGGKVWFDDALIRNDGHFLPDDLQQLNTGLA